MDIQRLRLTDQERGQCIDDTNLESKGKSYSVIMSGWIFDALTANTAEAQLAKALSLIAAEFRQAYNEGRFDQCMYEFLKAITQSGLSYTEVMSSP